MSINAVACDDRYDYVRLKYHNIFVYVSLSSLRQTSTDVVALNDKLL